MRIGKFNIISVCSNYDERYNTYGNIYENLDECRENHPNSEVIFGYYLKCDEKDVEVPDWFDTLKEAIDWANNYYLAKDNNVSIEAREKEDIENILRKWCSGHNYREYSEDMIDAIYNKVCIIIEDDLDGQEGDDIGRLAITEDMVLSAMMMCLNN